MKSRDIFFPGKNLVEVREVEIQEPGSDEFLVRATRSLISTGTEGIMLGQMFDAGTHWDWWWKLEQPAYRPGYSLVGQVVAKGKNIEHVQEGDRIALRYNHREYALVPATETVYHIPSTINDEDASWFHLATIVQNGVRRVEHQLGEDVAVIGLGLLGQLVVQYTRLTGARQIIAIDPAGKRLEWARDHGATTTLQMGAEEARDEVLRLTEGQGVHVVYDVTGSAPVFPQALRLLRQFGRLLLLGDTGSPASQYLTGDVITKGLSIIGAHDNNPPRHSTDHAPWSHLRMGELFFSYLQRGDMRVSDLITHRYSPIEAPEAYRMLREERSTAMGVIFDWTRLP